MKFITIILWFITGIMMIGHAYVSTNRKYNKNEKIDDQGILSVFYLAINLAIGIFYNEISNIIIYNNVIYIQASLIIIAFGVAIWGSLESEKTEKIKISNYKKQSYIP